MQNIQVHLCLLEARPDQRVQSSIPLKRLQPQRETAQAQVRRAARLDKVCRRAVKVGGCCSFHHRPHGSKCRIRNHGGHFKLNAEALDSRAEVRPDLAGITGKGNCHIATADRFADAIFEFEAIKDISTCSSLMYSAKPGDSVSQENSCVDTCLPKQPCFFYHGRLKSMISCADQLIPPATGSGDYRYCQQMFWQYFY